MPLVTPLSAGCRRKCVFGSPRAHSSARASDHCNSGLNKTHTISKREQISSSAYHKHPALMQPVFRAYSTSRHTGRGLAGHPRCVRMDNGYDKTRLFTPIRSKTTALPRCGRHHSAQRGRSSPARRGDESAGKGSHRSLPPAQSESGFYSRYFLIPKKDGGLRPILDLRLLNHALTKRSFRMITLKQILSQIRPGDWFMSLDLKDAYFHIQVAPHHRRFLRFAFEGVAYQYKVLPFGLSLAPRTFTRCMDAALSPLRQMGIRILNYLDDWLILAQSEAVSTLHKTLLLSHLDHLGLRVNFAKSMLCPCRACRFFLPDIRGHHVLIHSDSRSVVSYINHQGGLVSKRLCMLAKGLLVCAQTNLRSLKATHVPGKMNQGADMLSRNNVSSEEWTLHLLTVQRIWEVFGRARVDLFASEDNSYCPIYFMKSTDALA